MKTITDKFTCNSDTEGRSPDREDEQTRRPDQVPVPFQTVQGAEGSKAIHSFLTSPELLGPSIVMGSN
jgi:hypothetical protein